MIARRKRMGRVRIAKVSIEPAYKKAKRDPIGGLILAKATIGRSVQFEIETQPEYVRLQGNFFRRVSDIREVIGLPEIGIEILCF